MALGINGNASSRILNVLPKATCELHRMLNERCSTQCVSARKTEDTVVAQKNEQILRKGAIKALNSLSALVLVMEQCCLKVHMCDCPCCASIFIVCVWKDAARLFRDVSENKTSLIRHTQHNHHRHRITSSDVHHIVGVQSPCPLR